MPSMLVEKKDAVGVLTINRPETLNALDIPTLLELEQEFGKLSDDASIRVIVVTGAGPRAFIAGGDISDLNSRTGLPHYLEFAEIIQRVFATIEACDKPTIAAVNGWALGGGTELLLALDIRVVSEAARLGLPEITLGLFPGAGGTQRLIRQIPLCRAKELMFIGEQVTAQEALAIGLINRVVPKEDVMKTAMDLAEKIASKSTLVLKMLKRTLRHGAQMPLTSALAFEHSMVSLVLDSADSHEGCRAFLEKRSPSFMGE